MEGIQVSVEKIGQQGDIAIIRVGGYIDTTTSSEVERALDSLLKAGVFRIIIDLKNVDYISSAGWGIFISEIKGIRERGGDLKLASMIADVYEVFELLEFHYILKAFDTVDGAIQKFAKDSGKTFVIDEDSEIEEEELDDDATDMDDYEDVPDNVEDKIKAIAMAHPDWGTGEISKELYTEKYEYTRVGKLGVWKLLRKMNLSDKKQRLAAAREGGEDAV